jgi:hypothetical protein
MMKQSAVYIRVNGQGCGWQLYNKFIGSILPSSFHKLFGTYSFGSQGVVI